MRREDVYRILPKLQKLGLIERILGKPTKIRATPVEEALSLLIKREEEIAHRRVNTLITKKGEFVKLFNKHRIEPRLEEAHFTLISQREAVVNRRLAMIGKAERAIDIITSGDKFTEFFTNFDESLKKVIRKGVTVRVVLNITEHEDRIVRVLKEYKASNASFDLKYTDQPINHYMIVDYKHVLIATSLEPIIGQNPYLWTNDNSLTGLLQKNFESLWHTSVDVEAIETEGIAEKLTHFMKDLRPTNHVIFMYQSPEAKYNVLFNYLKIGLDNGEAVVYVASDENRSETIEAMKRFGIVVEEHEKTGALHILGYEDIYLINGKFNLSITLDSWKKLYDEALTRGFKGLRVTGETSCFFRCNLIPELIEYERALHRVLDIPMIAICAYDINMVMKASNPIDLYNELLKAHGTVLFTAMDNRVGKIEMRQA